MIQNCEFISAGEKKGRPVCRCQNTGCNNAAYSDDPCKIKPVRCKSKVHGEAIARAESQFPCIHRGDPTGETVTGCGCHVPAWQKQLYACAVHEGGCVLLKLKKRPGQQSCDGCRDITPPP